MNDKEKISSLMTYLYETMNGELALDYAQLNGENIKILLGYIEEKDKEIKRLNNIINELEKDLDNQITFCTNEANGTTNDKYCRIALNYLKHLKNKLQKLKEGVPSNE